MNSLRTHLEWSNSFGDDKDDRSSPDREQCSASITSSTLTGTSLEGGKGKISRGQWQCTRTWPLKRIRVVEVRSITYYGKRPRRGYPHPNEVH